MRLIQPDLSELHSTLSNQVSDLTLRAGEATASSFELDEDNDVVLELDPVDRRSNEAETLGVPGNIDRKGMNCSVILPYFVLRLCRLDRTSRSSDRALRHMR